MIPQRTPSPNACTASYLVFVQEGSTLPSVGGVEQRALPNRTVFVAGQMLTVTDSEKNLIETGGSGVINSPLMVDNMTGRSYFDSGKKLGAVTDLPDVVLFKFCQLVERVAEESSISSSFFYDVLSELRFEKALRAQRSAPRLMVHMSLDGLEYFFTLTQITEPIPVAGQRLALVYDSFLNQASPAWKAFSEAQFGSDEALIGYVNKLLSAHTLPIIHHRMRHES